MRRPFSSSRGSTEHPSERAAPPVPAGTTGPCPPRGAPGGDEEIGQASGRTVITPPTVPEDHVLDSVEGPTVSSFVLVHGSWHGPWCWYRVVPRLREAGHQVRTPQLPAHGVDPTAAADVTFADYVDCVCAAVDEAEEPPILVGHSMGGHAVTQAAEERAADLGRVVYLAAFLPADGQSLTDLDLSGYGSELVDHVVPDEERGTLALDPEGAVEGLYHDCSDEDVALAQSLLRPEPAGPRTVPVDLSASGYGSVPRTYVECTEDRSLPVAFQRAMRESVPCEDVRSLETSHSPFFSAPDELVGVLEAAAAG